MKLVLYDAKQLGSEGGKPGQAATLGKLGGAALLPPRADRRRLKPSPRILAARQEPDLKQVVHHGPPPLKRYAVPPFGDIRGRQVLQVHHDRLKLGLNLPEPRAQPGRDAPELLTVN